MERSSSIFCFSSVIRVVSDKIRKIQNCSRTQLLQMFSSVMSSRFCGPGIAGGQERCFILRISGFQGHKHLHWQPHIIDLQSLLPLVWNLHTFLTSHFRDNATNRSRAKKLLKTYFEGISLKSHKRSPCEQSDSELGTPGRFWLGNVHRLVWNGIYIVIPRLA